ncbi:protein pinocchio isoform X1 [Cimex lectularius]|uniref:Protein pinocchio n=1 Tax=Cimex lectularius TaxID=79782 RepID=A0A8I6SMA5_CIMLE|nr:protein pinocchio isoform X1 [Cimex lectularius]
MATKFHEGLIHVFQGIMSVASVHPVSGLTNRSQSYTSVSSLDDVTSYCPSEHVLSIEELRLQLNSCFTCGVSWTEDHVSLDCSECGGYSLERPCPLCDGHCSAVWKRDLTMSHACGKARWEGCCTLLKPQDDETRLCNRLEKLTASS